MKPPKEPSPCPRKPLKFTPPEFPKFPKLLPFMADSVAKGASRPMKFPYTFSAKIAQFPWKFYMTNTWQWKYYAVAVLVSFPLFYKIGKMSYDPANVKKWEEIRRKEFTPHH